MQAKSQQLRDLPGISPMDAAWSIPSMADKLSLIWMREVKRPIIEVRQAPGEVQETAYRTELAPSMPDA
jgi:hypothetical protein